MDFWERLMLSEERGGRFVGRAAVARAFDIDLLIDQPHHCIAVAGVAHCEVLEEGCKEIRFVLGRNVERDSFADVAIAKLQLNALDVAWTQDGDCCSIALPQAMVKGETFALSFEYVATPLARKCWVHSRADGFVPELGDDETELCYEGCWLPVFDNVFSTVTTDIRIRESLGQRVIFNGRLVETEETENGVVYHFTSVMPGWPTVMVGDFAAKAVTYGDARIACHFQPGYERSVDIALALAQQIVQLYTDWFAVNPVTDATLVQLRRTGYGQYAPSPLVAFPRQDLWPDSAYPSPHATPAEQTREELVPMLSHELGHFWFGGLVRYPPNQMWIGEGLATYLSQLVLEQLQGNTIIPQLAEAVAGIPRHEQAPLADLPLGHPHGHLLVRAKAALVLHLLRQELGDEQFLLLLRTLVVRLQHTVATTSCIAQVCCELLPDRHCEEFFRQHFWGVQEYVFDPQRSVLAVKTPGT